MKKKILFLLLLISLTLGITYGEYKYIENQFAEKPEKEVLFLSSSVKEGHQFTEDDFIMKALNMSDVEKNYVTNMSKAIGTYANKELFSGTLLLESDITSVSQLKFAKDASSIWITFEFSGATSNGWNLRENQEVKLLFSPKDGRPYTLYEDVIVKRIYDENVMDNSTSEADKLKYVTFEIDSLKGYELLSKRDAGRIEIIIL